MNIISNNKIVKLFAGIILLVASFTANAVPIVQGSTNAATGISGLDIGGTLYDVAFFNDSYNNVFSSSAPTFLGDGASAQLAASAIASVFNSSSVTGILDLTDINGSPIYIDIPTAEFGGFYDTWSVFSGASWKTGFTAGVVGGSFSQVSTAFATFTLAPGSGSGGKTGTSVPEPATLALMSLGLVGLGFSRKRK